MREVEQDGAGRNESKLVVRVPAKVTRQFAQVAHTLCMNERIDDGGKAALHSRAPQFDGVLMLTQQVIC